jgi:uncharacterized ferredoxin-like protein
MYGARERMTRTSENGRAEDYVKRFAKNVQSNQVLWMLSLALLASVSLNCGLIVSDVRALIYELRECRKAVVSDYRLHVDSEEAR